ncbi:MAG: TrmH family RNA methyltransferase [Candidatus Baltobacteraceae bacterium]
MPVPLGAHNAQIADVRDLREKKGRRAQGRFAFEGPTLLDEAMAAGAQVHAVYATAQAYERFAQPRTAERAGIPVYLIDKRSLARISDVATPAGVVSVSSIADVPAASLFESDGLVAILAGVADPGNAGTLLRAAEAFGVDRVLFSGDGVEPHHPKVVRSAMGALFRLRIAAARPAQAAGLISGWTVTGLDASGEPIPGLRWPSRSALVVGSERRGLGPWAPLCTRLAAIPMRGHAESLNAAVAGAIGLYEAAKRLQT